MSEKVMFEYIGKDTEKFRKNAFKKYFIVDTCAVPFGFGYGDFSDEEITVCTDSVCKNCYILKGKNVYEYKNNEFKLIGKNPRSAKQIYKFYKKAFLRIDNYNKKYKTTNNPQLPLDKIKIFGFERFRYCEKSMDYTLSYCLRTPEKLNSNEKLPLYIFLHGYGNGGEKAVVPLIQARNFYKKIDKNKAIMLIPSLPKLLSFDTDLNGSSPLNGRTAFDGIFTGLIKYIAEKYSVDTSKIHIIGTSNGACGVYTQIFLHPKRYASAIAMMGAASSGNMTDFYGSLKETPLWLAHAADDRCVNIGKAAVGTAGGSDVIFDCLGGRETDTLKYTRYEKGGHRVDQQFLKESNWYEWTKKQTRNNFEL